MNTKFVLEWKLHPCTCLSLPFGLSICCFPLLFFSCVCIRFDQIQSSHCFAYWSLSTSLGFFVFITTPFTFNLTIWRLSEKKWRVNTKLGLLLLHHPLLLHPLGSSAHSLALPQGYFPLLKSYDSVKWRTSEFDLLYLELDLVFYLVCWIYRIVDICCGLLVIFIQAKDLYVLIFCDVQLICIE